MSEVASGSSAASSGRLETEGGPLELFDIDSDASIENAALSIRVTSSQAGSATTHTSIQAMQDVVNKFRSQIDSVHTGFDELRVRMDALDTRVVDLENDSDCAEFNASDARYDKICDQLDRHREDINQTRDALKRLRDYMDDDNEDSNSGRVTQCETQCQR